MECNVNKKGIRHMPSRQVHLDFHTSQHVPAVGSKFDKKEFQEALLAGHVNSMTVFGKCHHGYHYYPTEVGTIHPGLEPGRDLAREMMDACHEIGVYAPLYLTLGWSALDAEEHPEWIARNRDGSYQGRNYDFNAGKEDVKPGCSWADLCSAGAYRQYLYDMTREACDRYERLDGLFYDIVFGYDVCYCDSCVKGMKRMGLDPGVEEDAKKYYQIEKKVTLDGLREIIKEKHPNATIFFNSGGAEIHMPQWHYASTHFELEDLPTSWGGYDKMPLRARFFAGKGKEFLGMTGKFHGNWGEFGGFKTPEALKYECAAMLANGARVSVGDQLHPLGKMDMNTYRTIGEAYEYVEQIESYCFDTTETAKLGVMVSLDSRKNEAMAKLLLDCQLDFDVVHGEPDLDRFDTVILPDGYQLTANWGIALDAFLERGGKLLMLGGSGLKEDEDVFAISLPWNYEGKSEFDIDYLEVEEHCPSRVVKSPILCYTSAHKIEGPGEVQAYVREPYFSRTYGTYCSHLNTPYQEERAAYPGAIREGNVLYVAHELAALYLEHGVTYHRRYFKWLLQQLYQAEVVIAELPSQGRVHFVRRKQEKQYVLHLMYASPVQRGNVSILEDFPTLYNIKVTIHVPEKIISMRLIPQDQELTFEETEAGCVVVVPELTGHQMVVLEYRERR